MFLSNVTFNLAQFGYSNLQYGISKNNLVRFGWYYSKKNILYIQNCINTKYSCATNSPFSHVACNEKNQKLNKIEIKIHSQNVTFQDIEVVDKFL